MHDLRSILTTTAARGPAGMWLAGEQHFDANRPRTEGLIPTTPALTGQSSVNALDFETSTFSDPQGADTARDPVACRTGQHDAIFTPGAAFARNRPELRLGRNRGLPVASAFRGRMPSGREYRARVRPKTSRDAGVTGLRR
jgi:hypothetical protein